MIKLKYCRNCGKTKPVKEFSSRGGKNKQWLKTYCKTCSIEKMNEWVAKNRKRFNKYHREYKK